MKPKSTTKKKTTKKPSRSIEKKIATSLVIPGLIASSISSLNTSPSQAPEGTYESDFEKMLRESGFTGEIIYGDSNTPSKSNKSDSKVFLDGDGIEIKNEQLMVSQTTSSINLTIDNLVGEEIDGMVAGNSNVIYTIQSAWSELSNGTVSIKFDSTGSGTFLEILSDIQVFDDVSGDTFVYDVVEIEEDGFTNLTTLQSIDFSNADNLTSIGANAFNGTGLTNLDLTSLSNSTTIASGAFNNCLSLNDITVASVVTTLGVWATSLFQGCSTNTTLTVIGNTIANGANSSTGFASFLFGSSITSLTTANFQSTLTDIGDYAFDGCSNLSSIDFNSLNSLVSVGNYSFNNCAINESFTIASSTTSIGIYAFNGNAITALNCSNSTSLSTIGSNAFSDCGSLNSVDLLNATSLASVGSNAFSNNASLANIKINASNTISSVDTPVSYGSGAFSNLTSSVALTVAGQTIAYGSNTSSSNFVDNLFLASKANITSISLSESITTVADYAFYNCSNLSTITFYSTFGASNYVNYGSSVFSNCSNSVTLNIKGTSIQDGVSSNTGFAKKLFSTSINSIVQVNLDASLVSIGAYAFNDCTKLSIIDLSNVDEIGQSGFENCSSLTSADLSSVDVLSESVFAGCSSLNDVSLSLSLTTISQSAFENCSSLSEIIIPMSVTTIGDSAFAGSGITTVDLTNLNPSIDIGNNVFANCNDLEEIIIDGSVDYTGMNLFDGVSGPVNLIIEGSSIVDYGSSTSLLQELFGSTFNSAQISVSIPNTMRTIGANAFNGCYGSGIGINLANVSAITSFGNYAFNGCGSSLNLNSLTTNSSMSIGQSAFAGTDLLTLDISQFNSIGLNAFNDCSKLSNITLNGNISQSAILFQGCAPSVTLSVVGTTINSSSAGRSLPLNLFNTSSSSVETVNIAASIQTIGDNAFNGCSSITQLVIPPTSALTDIGNNAFNGCGFSSINLPTGLLTIGNSAFENCEFLTSIDLPASLTSIGTNAFASSGLQSIDLSNLNTSIPIGANAFANCNDIETIIINGEKDYSTLTLFSGITNPLDLIIKGSSIANYVSGKNLLSELFGASYLSMSINVTIESSITTIGAYAFDGCNAAGISINIASPSTITSYGNYAFNGCGASLKLTSLTTNSSMSIGQNAFAGTNLTTVDISQYSSIGTNAFINCNYLTNVTINGNFAQTNALFQGCGSPLTLSIVGSSISAASGSNILLGWFGTSSGNITTVNIASSITSIGNNAFNGCSNLAYVNIEPTSLLATIGDGAFKNTSISTITLTTNLTAIGVSAFEGSSISSITLPSGLITIGSSAFKDCTSLVAIAIPNTVMIIGNDAFNNTGIETIDLSTLNAGINIGTNAFANCNNISEIIIDGARDYTGLTLFSNINNPLELKIRGSSISNYVSGKNLLSELFGSTYLSMTIAVEIESSVLTIGAYAFDGCAAANISINITSPSTITSYGNYAFNGCGASLKLTSLTVANAAVIGTSAFKGTNLNTVDISLASSVGVSAFSNCSSLATITINGNISQTNSIFDGCAANVSLTINGTTITASATNLISSLFSTSANAVSSVTLAASITSIGNNTFNGCSYITTLVIPNNSNLQSIGNYAFTGCNFSSIYLPNTLETIGNNAFQNCGNLTSISFPSSLTNIGSDAFNGSGLQRIDLFDLNPLILIGTNAFANCASLYEITINGAKNYSTLSLFNSVVGPLDLIIKGSSISNYGPSTSLLEELFGASYQAISINVYIQSTVTSIGNYAFWNCSGTNIQISFVNIAAITNFGSYAFYNCGTSLNLATFTSAATTVVGTYAFSGTALTAVDLSAVNSVGAYAFSNCSGLANIAINGNILQTNPLFTGCASTVDLTVNGTSITASVATTNILTNLFSTSSTSVKNITIASTVTSIGNNVFDGCSSITNIILPNSLTTIGNNAFRNCTGITNLAIPNSVQTIGDNAFYNCIFASTTFNSSNVLTSIGANAFYGTNFTTVDLSSSRMLSTIGAGAFSNIVNLNNIIARMTFENSTGVYQGDVSYGTAVFAGCSSSVSLQVNGTQISSSIFSGSTNLLDFLFGVTDANKVDSLTIGNDIVSIADSAFIGTNISSLTFQVVSSLQTIGINAFANTAALATNITIPASVVTISQNAFSNSAITGLNLSLATSLQTIGNNAFYQCSSLVSSITIPSAVTSIGNFAFSQSPIASLNLSTATNLLTIGQNAFENCTSLAGTITFPSKLTTINSSAFNNCPLITAINFTTATALNTIGASAFNGTGITSLDLMGPSALTTLGQAFVGCALTSIRINYNSYSYSNAFLGITGTNVSFYVGRGITGTFSSGSNFLNYLFGSDNTRVTQLTIGATVPSIAANAFINQTSLTSITFENYASSSLTRINAFAFMGCTNVTSQIMIPYNVTIVGQNAFRDVGGTSAVYAGNPSAVTALNVVSVDGGYIFYSWNSAGYIWALHADNPSSTPSIPTQWDTMNGNQGPFVNVRGIASYAFFNCTNFGKTLNIPSSVLFVNEHAFDGCTFFSIAHIYVDASGTVIVWGGNNFISGYSELDLYIHGTYIADGTQATNFISNLFGPSDRANIKSITIDNTFTYIGNYAFYGCTGVTSLWFTSTSSITAIGESAFENCGSDVINNHTLDIIIPQSVNFIGTNAFKNVANLYNVGGVYLSNENGNDNNSRWVLWTDSTATDLGLVNWNENVKGIAQRAFYGKTNFTGNLILPDTLKYVNDEAFVNCSGFNGALVMTTNCLWKTVTRDVFVGCTGFNTIVDGVLYSINGLANPSIYTWCIGLTNSSDWATKTTVNIAENTYAIANNAFYNCTALNNISLFSNYYIASTSYSISIGTNSFVNIGSNITLTVNGQVIYNYNAGAVNFIDQLLPSDKAKLNTLVLADSMQAIAANAFNNCSNLYNITLPASYKDAMSADQYLQLTTATNGVFYGCRSNVTLTVRGVNVQGISSSNNFILNLFGTDLTKIQTLNIDNTIVAIGAYAFYNVSGVTTLTFNAGSELTTIGSNAFYGAQESTLVLPNTLQLCGVGAFANNNKLTQIQLPSTYTNGIGVEQFTIYNGIVFSGLSINVAQLKIVGTAIDNGSSATNNFAYNLFGTTTNLIQTIVFDSSKTMTSVGNYAFYSCSSITTIDISTLTSLGSNAFENCTSLSTIAIPSTIATLKTETFKGCSNLLTINLTSASSLVEIQASCFENCIKVTSITLPGTIETLGNYVFRGCSTLASITLHASYGILNNAVTLGDGIFLNCANSINLSVLGVIIHDYGSSATDNFSYHLFGAQNTRVVALSLASTITSIGKYAFYGCSGINQVLNLSTLTNLDTIDSYAFANCSSLSGTLSFATGLTQLTKLNSYSFSGCSSITAINLGTNLTQLEQNVFDGCSSITSISIPNQFRDIADAAFANCSNLSTITLFASDGTNHIQFGDGIFAGCRANTTMNVYGEIIESNSQVDSFSYWMFGNDKGKLTTLLLHSSINEIETYAFNGCTNLNNISIYASNTNGNIVLGTNIFDGSSSTVTLNVNGETVNSYNGALANTTDNFIHNLFTTSKSTINFTFNIANTITTIDNYSFYGCTAASLLNFASTSTLTTIGISAFEGCSSLYGQTALGRLSLSLVLPSLQTINNFAFKGCSNLFLINSIGNNVSTIGTNAFENCTSMTQLLFASANNLLATISAEAFKGCSSLASINLSNATSLTLIDTSAFENCIAVNSITFASSIQEIGNSAFKNCSGALTTIDLSQITNLDEIKDSAFANCSLLNNITLSASYSVASVNTYLILGNEIFKGCASSVTLTVKNDIGGSSQYSGATNDVKGFAYYLFDSSRSSITTLNITSSVTSIGDFAFYGLSGLISLTLPNSVSDIYASAFSQLSSLVSLSLWATDASNNYVNYESNIFAGNSGSLNLTVNGTKIIGGTSTDNFIQTLLGTELSTLNNLIIANTITEIGAYAFYNCQNANSIVINATSALATIKNNAFKNFANLNSSAVKWNLTALSNLTIIEASAFENCSTLFNNLIIPANVSSIGNSAFANCTSLLSIYFADNTTLTSIGSKTFENCTNLSSIDLSLLYGLGSIDYEAFAGCSNLQTIKIRATYVLTSAPLTPLAVNYGVRVFEGCATGAQLYIYGTFIGGSDVYTSLSSKGLGATVEQGFAFYLFGDNVDHVSSITIDASITSIGDYAFYDCVNVTSLVFTQPASLISIGDSAFELFSNNVASLNFSLPTLVNLTTIGNRAFAQSNIFTHLVISNLISSIGTEAFINCTSITSITFNANSVLTQILTSTFEGCSSLTTIDLTNLTKLSLLDNKAFYNCSSLASITLNASYDDSSTTYFLTLGKQVFEGCAASVSLSVGGRQIQDQALAANSFATSLFGSSITSLTSLTIQQTVEQIGNNAFINSINLSSITFAANSNLYRIGQLAFSNTGFTSIDLAGLLNLANIQDEAFKGCIGLTSIALNATYNSGSSNISLGDNIFLGCSTTTNSISLTVGGSSIANGLVSDNFALSLFGSDLYKLTSLTIKQAMQVIGNYAFVGAINLATIVFESNSNVNTIGKYAFSSNTTITSIDLLALSKLSLIDDNAFANCSSLQTISLNTTYNTGTTDLPVSFGNNVFLNCASGITLNLTGKFIDDYIPAVSPTKDNTGITYALFGVDKNKINAINLYGQISSIGASAFYNCVNVSTFTIEYPATVVQISTSAFEKFAINISTHKLNLGTFSSLTTIGASAFKDCVTLFDTINIPSTVASIGANAFDGCTSATLVNFATNNVLTDILNDTFANCIGLTSIDLSMLMALENVSATTFANCLTFNTISIRSTILKASVTTNVNYGQGIFEGHINSSTILNIYGTKIGGADFYTGSAGANGFAYYLFSSSREIISQINFVGQFDVIGTYAFYNCTDVNKITFSNPGSLIKINESAFENAAINATVLPINRLLLQSFTSLEDIGIAAFKNSNLIGNLVIAGTIKTIGAEAFMNCDSIETITFELNSNLSVINENTFANCVNVRSIDLRNLTKLAQIKDNAFSGCPNLAEIKLNATYNNGAGDINLGTQIFTGCASNVDLTVGGTRIKNGVSTTDNFIVSLFDNEIAKLTNLIIESTITEIGDYAFYNCSDLATLSFGGTSQITRFGISAFENCSIMNMLGGTKLNLSGFSSLATIDINAFKNCANLFGTLTIPSLIATIGASAFEGCSSMTSITFANNDVLTILNDNVFKNCIGLVSIDLSQTNRLGTISELSFADCSAITNISVRSTYYNGTIETTVNFGSGVFKYCSDDVTLNVYGEYIGAYTPGSGSTAGFAYRLFNENITNLITVNIKTPITLIAMYAFYGCINATAINFDDASALETIANNAFENFASNVSGTTTKLDFEDFTSLTTIGDSAFRNSNIIDVLYISKNVSSIGQYAFADCSSITSVDFDPANIVLTTIQNNTFENCSNLASIDLTGLSKLANIKDQAFYNCPLLAIIKLNATWDDGTTAQSDITLGVDIFVGCANSVSLTVGGTRIYNGTASSYFAKSLFGLQLTNVAQLSSLTILNTITDIGDYAFYRCLVVETLKFEENSQLTRFGKYSFAFFAGNMTLGAGRLDLRIFANLQVIDNNAFDRAMGTLIYNLVIPSTVKEIGQSAFYQIYIRSVAFEANNLLTTLNDNTFSWCLYLHTIDMSNAYVLSSVSALAFENCPELKTISIRATYNNSGVQAPVYYGAGVFSSCVANTTLNIYGTSIANGTSATSGFAYNLFTSALDNLNTIVFKDAITLIGDYAFYGCDSASTVTFDFPETLLSIGTSAFENCGSIAIGTISKIDFSSFSVLTSIGDYTFRNSKLVDALYIGQNVANIGQYAFADCSTIVSVQFASANTSLVAIKNNTFENCSNLTSIDLTGLSMLTSLGNQAFYNCSSLATIKLNATYNNGAGDISLGTQVFTGCASNVDLTVGGTRIKNGTSTADNFIVSLFDNEISKLTNLVFESSMTMIGDYAFYGCNNLQTMNFINLDSMVRFGNSCFEGCSNVTLPAGAKLNLNNLYNLTTIGTAAFKNCANLFGYLSISWYVSSIGANAFDGCSSMLGVSIMPNSALTTLEANVFANCTNLLSVQLEYAYSLSTINALAFVNCENINSINIRATYNNSGVQQPVSYGQGVFSYITGKVHLDVYGSFIADGANATSGFAYNLFTSAISNLNSVRFREEITSIGSYAFYGCINATGLQFVSPEILVSIGDHAFENYSNNTVNGINTKLDFSAFTSLLSIGDYAFRNSKICSTLYIGDSIANIGQFAFADCSTLATVVFSSGNTSLTEIKNNTFENCSLLTSIDLTGLSMLQALGNQAFYNCPLLATIKLNATYNNGAGQIGLGTQVFTGCAASVSLTIGGKYIYDGNQTSSFVKSLFDNDASKITNLTILNTITSIGMYAFYQCSGLQTINFEADSQLARFGASAFEGCSIATLTAGAKLNLSVFTGLTTIETKAFKDCANLFGSVTLPSGLTTLGISAFENCSSLSSLAFATGSTLLSIPQSAFMNCTNLISLDFTNSAITLIDNNAFSGCSKLTTVDLSKATQLNSINDNAFANCTLLNNITIVASTGTSYITLGLNIFSGCSNNVVLNISGDNIGGADIYIGNSTTTQQGFTYHLFGNDRINVKTININSSVVTIGTYAFYGCGISSLVFANGNLLTTIGAYAFSNCANLLAVDLLPAINLTTLGTYAFSECTSLNSIKLNATYNNGTDTALSIAVGVFEGCSSSVSLEVNGAFIGNYNSGVASTSGFAYRLFGTSKASLTSLVLDSAITRIGQYAFYGCTGLSGTLSFANLTNLTLIDISAFEGCININGTLDLSMLTKLTEIGDNAFKDLYKINTIKIRTTNDLSNDITFGNYIFAGCNSSVGLEVYGLRVLDYSNAGTANQQGFAYTLFGADKINISSLVLDNAITYIGAYAFYGCVNIAGSLNLSTLTQLLSVSDYAFYNCSSINSLSLPTSLQSIGNYAFSGLVGLTSYTLDLTPMNNLSSIGTQAFERCMFTTIKLNATYANGTTNYITLGSDIFANGASQVALYVGGKAIGDVGIYSSLTYSLGAEQTQGFIYYLFGNSRANIMTLTLGSELENIGSYAFYGCSSIASIVIPSATTSIGTKAFYGCSNLNNITLTSSYNQGAFNSAITLDGDIFTGCKAGTTLNINGIIIGNYGNSATDPENQLGFMYYLFGADVNNVAVINFANTITGIGDYAFYGCSNVNTSTSTLDLRIMPNLAEIGTKAFYGWSQINIIYISASYNDGTEKPIILGNQVFAGIGNNISLHVSGKLIGGSEVFYTGTNDLDKGFVYYLFGSDRENITNLYLASTIEAIGSFAFYGLMNVNNIQIYASVNNNAVILGSNIFAGGNTNITLTVKGSLIGNYSTGVGDTTGFMDKLFNSDKNNVTKVILDSTITSIGDYAFIDCLYLTTINLDKVQLIGISAFENCSSLFSIAGYTELDLASISSLGVGAFKGCSSIKTLIIAGTLENIADEAFEDCIGITTITFKEGLKTIGISSFENCNQIVGLVIPSSTIAIGAYAFYDCTNLLEVKILNETSVITYSEGMFDNTAIDGITGFVFVERHTMLPQYLESWATQGRDFMLHGFKEQYPTGLPAWAWVCIIGIPLVLAGLGGGIFFLAKKNKKKNAK